MTDMFIGLEIGFKDQTFTHGVSSQLCNVNWGLDCASQLQLVGFYWDNLNKWHLSYQFFRVLIVKAITFHVPSGTFEIDTLDVGSLIESLCDLLLIEDLGYLSVHHGFIECPSLGSASCLDQSGKIRFWDV